MTNPKQSPPIFEMRVAVTSANYDRLAKFYCNRLGIEPAQFWNNGQGQALTLDMGHAALEIVDEAQAETIDQIETEKRISGQVRFALQVPDLKAAMKRLLAHGAKMVHLPVITPWGDYNVRFQDPDGMQITLFQVLEKKRTEYVTLDGVHEDIMYCSRNKIDPIQLSTLRCTLLGIG